MEVIESIIFLPTIIMLDKKEIFTGTQIAYTVLCETKLWYFSHFIRMEQGSDLVAQGKILNENAFQREKKDKTIDDKISIDIIRKENGILLREIKKSKKLEKAHIFQLLYYLYFLKQKGILATGELVYPLSREVKNVELTEQAEKDLLSVMEKTKNIVSLGKPPPPNKKPYCRKCSYFNLCWVK